MLREAPHTIPQSGFLWAICTRLPVGVGHGPYWPICQRRKLRLRDDNQLTWGLRVIGDRVPESNYKAISSVKSASHQLTTSP